MKFLVSSASLVLLLNSCSLVTTPVKVLGTAATAATTTIKTTGKIVGAGIDVASSDSKDEVEEPLEEEAPTDVAE